MTDTFKPLNWLRNIAAFTLAALPVQGFADDVTLTSTDGSVRLVGELLDVGEDFYLIKSRFGEVRVPASNVACEGQACPAPGTSGATLGIAGSDTIGEELMPLLLTGLAEASGGGTRKSAIDSATTAVSLIAADGRETLKAEIEFKGSSTGFAALLNGAADLGMSSRLAKPEEIAAFADAGLGDLTDPAQEHAFAVDGLLVIVNPALPIDALGAADIAGLLSGRITNWAEVGGPDLAVTVYSRNSKSGTYATITDVLLKPVGAEMSPNAVIVDHSDALSAAVATDTGGIGYVGFAFLGDAKSLGLISSCDLVNEPSSFNAKTGEYDLSRRLYLYNTNRALPPAATEILTFANSEGAYPYIEKAGFLSYLPEARAQTAALDGTRDAIKATASASEGAALRELFFDLTEWNRLSTTFRFRTGSAALDNTSLLEIDRLAAWLKGHPETTEIALVGFTDSDGPFEANRKLGLGRAEAVRTLIAARLADEGLTTTLTVKSYGELNPVACNTDTAGQRNNRRVEVWVP